MAVEAETAQEVAVLAEEAWSARQESAAALFLDGGTRTREAHAATRVAFRLADLAARQGLVGTLRGGRVLGEGASASVLRWLLRIDAPTHRLLAARLRVPEGARVDRVGWQRALTERDASIVERMVREIRTVEPTWLLNDPSLAETSRWLRSGGDSVAIGAWPGQGGVLLA